LLTILRMVDEAGLLLVVGSSLAVFSGCRFAPREAARADRHTSFMPPAGCLSARASVSITKNHGTVRRPMLHWGA
jgi:hypothetical protein